MQANMQLPFNQDYDTHNDQLMHTAIWDRRSKPPQLLTQLDGAIKQSQELLLSLQHPDGYWWGELEGNATITSQTVLLYKILGVEDRYPLSKMENYIRRTQGAHGGWELFHGDGGYLSATIESYMALRLLGVPKTDPALQRALKVIIQGGGVSKSRMFTKICLALIGAYDWQGIPSLPPWLMLLPSWFPSGIYDMACWARGCVVPLIVIFDKRPVFKIIPEVSFDELYAEGRENARFSMPFAGDWTTKFFVGVDYAFKAMERMGILPFRQWGLKEAEKWLLRRQEDTGDFVGVYPPMFYSIVCMKILNYEVTDPVFHKAILSLKTFSAESRDECRVQSSLSPVWDTAFVVRSLVESGMKPDHPALQKAGEWLLKKQIIKPGDWAHKNPSKKGGGWAFEFFNRWYPDVDDTAAVVMALDAVQLENEDVKQGAIAYAVEWIRCMQCRKGGWAAYDKDNDQHWLNSTPFGDLKAMIDPNTIDVTARVLEMAGRLNINMLRPPFPAQPAEGNRKCCDGTGAHAAAAPASLPARLINLPPEAIAKGLLYLRKGQEKEGCWYGCWGVNYIYGTCGALLAMSLAAPPKTHYEEIRRGAKWLVEVQNKRRSISVDVDHGRCNEECTILSPSSVNTICGTGAAAGDGGWGETCFSYVNAALKGRGEASTASQTAWAVQGLLAAGDALQQLAAGEGVDDQGLLHKIEESMDQGVEYLIGTQRKDGSWHEKQFTGGAFPGHFYLRYHLYAQHFPLSALSRYRDRQLRICRR